MTLTEPKATSPDRSPAARHSPPAHRARHGHPIAFLVAAVAGVAVLVALLYVASIHAGTPDSDGATVVLQGQSMSAGHLTLQGWSLSLDSFWTVDALFYMLAVRVIGVRFVLFYLVPAVIAALVVVVGALLARHGRRGVAGVAAAATVVALLGLPSHVLAIFFLRGPLHVGTTLWCLLAFAGLRRGRLGWGWAAAVMFMALGALGDFQMVALGLVPVALAGLVAMGRTRDWRAGAPTVAAPFAAVALAGVVRALALIVGTFSIGKVNARASKAQMVANLKHVGPMAANLLGVGNGSFGNAGVPSALEAVHVVGLAVVIAGVAVAAAGLIWGTMAGRHGSHDRSEGWRLDDLLVLACGADVVVFLVLAISNDRSYARYLTAGVIFGAILGGRWVGRVVAAVDWAWFRRGGAVLGVATIAAFAAALSLFATSPRPQRAFASLGPFLEAHGLHDGIGDYWSSSVTTVATNDSVTVRPVTLAPDGLLVRYGKQSTAAWYANQRFQFLVYDTAVPWGGVDLATATATFGVPDHTYPVGSYRVLVWSYPLSVSTVGFGG